MVLSNHSFFCPTIPSLVDLFAIWTTCVQILQIRYHGSFASRYQPTIFLVLSNHSSFLSNHSSFCPTIPSLVDLFAIWTTCVQILQIRYHGSFASRYQPTIFLVLSNHSSFLSNHSSFCPTIPSLVDLFAIWTTCVQILQIRYHGSFASRYQPTIFLVLSNHSSFLSNHSSFCPTIPSLVDLFAIWTTCVQILQIRYHGSFASRYQSTIFLVLSNHSSFCPTIPSLVNIFPLSTTRV